MDTTPYINVWTEQKAAYNQRDLILYALGINAKEHNWTFEQDQNFAAFPTFPLVLLFKGESFDVVSFPSPMMMGAPALPPLPGVKVGLDGERYVECIRPLDPEGGELTVKSRIIGVHKRGTGASVESETVISDKKGPVYRLVSGAFLVGAKDFKDSGVTNSEAVSVPKRAPDHVEKVKTDESMPLLYRLSGDYNPLHVDQDMASMSGFEKPIMHGLCSFGISCHAVIKSMLDNDAAKFKAIKGRFASPVMPGDTLEIKMWKEADRIIFTTSSVESGKVCVNNAYVLINNTEAKL
ncbi:hypothetical protein BASA81_002514 [Batrachochytrium salamandrivorans]|nr:hypothetical protein BASA81_002514 [Batrachochytrium salamandrivorans]